MCAVWCGIVWYGFAWLGMSKLCYAMIYAILCHAMLCYVMLCYAMICYPMLYYDMLSYAMLCYSSVQYVSVVLRHPQTSLISLKFKVIHLSTAMIKLPHRLVKTARIPTTRPQEAQAAVAVRAPANTSGSENDGYRRQAKMTIMGWAKIWTAMIWSRVHDDRPSKLERAETKPRKWNLMIKRLKIEMR